MRSVLILYEFVELRVAFVDRKLMLVAPTIHILVLRRKTEDLHIRHQILTHELDALDDLRQVHLKFVQKVTEELVDAYVVIEDQVGGFAEVVHVLCVDFLLVLALLLLFQPHSNDEVHRAEDD